MITNQQISRVDMLDVPVDKLKAGQEFIYQLDQATTIKITVARVGVDRSRVLIGETRPLVTKQVINGNDKLVPLVAGLLLGCLRVDDQVTIDPIIPSSGEPAAAFVIELIDAGPARLDITQVTKDVVWEKVKNYLSEMLEIDPGVIKTDSSLNEDLDVDSLVLFEFQLWAGATFGVMLEDDELDELKTVADVVRLIKAKSPTQIVDT